MSKKRNVIIGVIALLLLVSVGYALFSDTLNINGTATAKGDFSFSVTTQKGVMDEINSESLTSLNSIGMRRTKATSSGLNLYSSYVSDETGIESSTITNTSNTVTINASMNMPGQSQYFTIKVTNTGSIPITIDVWDEFIKEINIKGKLLMDDGGEVDPDTIMDMVAATIENPYGLDSADDVAWRQFKSKFLELKSVIVPKERHNEFVNNLNENPNAFVEIRTGESFYIICSVAWGNAFNNERIKGLEAEGTINIELPIKQYVN